MSSVRVRLGIPENIIQSMGQPGVSLSLRVATMIDRFCAMCQAAMPEFTEAEWRAILDANNPTSDADHVDAPDPERIWRNLEQTPDAAALVDRLRGLSRVELIAVQEACSRYWAHEDLPEQERFRAAWIVPRLDT